jgi:hypothetical protein
LCDADNISFYEMPAFCAIIHPACHHAFANFVAFATVVFSLM